MQFGITQRDLTADVRLIAVAGELDLAVADQLQTALAQASSRRMVLIDLSLCEFVDSSAISAFLLAERERRPKGQRLILVAPSKQVARVLDMTGLSANGLVFATVEAAIAVAAGGA